MCCMETAVHAMSIPNGRFLITSQKLQQVKEAVIPELKKFLPPWMIEKETQTPLPYFKLKNGHEILVFASNDEEKLRSLNLTGFYIEEASGVDLGVFHQLQARLRNELAIIRDEYGNEVGDQFMGILSTNPEDCWIVPEFLLKSSVIMASEHVPMENYRLLQDREPIRNFHSFLSSTRDNKYLPKSYLEDTCAGKSRAWVRKYVDCDLGVREGLVYPKYAESFVEPFEIPKHWLRVAGYDKGFADPTAMLIGAICPADGTIYFYQEYKVTEQPISYHAEKVKNMVHGLEFWLPIQADPSIQNRNERDGTTYQDYFYSLSGIWLDLADNNIDNGIEQVRDYMHSGRIKFFNNLVETKKEFSTYAYKSSNTTNVNDKPVDFNNHLMDALRYCVKALPQNPRDMFTEIIAMRFRYDAHSDEGVTVEENVYTTGGWA